MTLVFISHSSADEEHVQKIKSALTSQGFQPYVALMDPNPGRHISKKVEESIIKSDVFLLIVSRSSNNSPWVQQEIGFAKERLPIIPVSIDDSRAPALLEGVECINISSIDLGSVGGLITTAISKWNPHQKEKDSKVCDEGPYEIETGEYLEIPLLVMPGDVIAGRIEEIDGDGFDWYIVNESNLVDYKSSNGHRFNYILGEEDNGVSIVRKKIPERPKGPWYLILTMYNKRNNRIIHVRLRKE